MSEITFLASSKSFIIPDEIQEYNNRTVFERIEDVMGLWVEEVESDGWGESVEGLFTLPYIYEITGADSQLFLFYLEKYMEVGDVIELLHFPNQHNVEYYISRLSEHPESIFINVGSFTYQDKYGTYQLNSKNWVEELSHKNFLTEYGVTTIVKY
ncbi:hypothetical protein FS935_01045 [Metabacillus litoralis]|uniref:Uncharacterized protein n=1 Tax=Metabacillus litoralis TaxID=152268 RepID=A0A5C6W4D9_9BACI|nr:hypothetical protein [Metabacillus litoralis]TXC92817.1 hypothetical protein FS935_01045 [Metabacillus litoralis]